MCDVLLIKSAALGVSIADRGYSLPCTFSVSALGQLQSQKVKLNDMQYIKCVASTQMLDIGNPFANLQEVVRTKLTELNFGM